MTNKTLYFAQVSIVLLFIFFDYSGINAHSQGIDGLVFHIFP